MPLISGITFLTPSCAVDYVKFTPENLTANFAIEGTQTVVTGGGTQTVTGTMSGTDEIEWSRMRGFKDIYDRTSNATSDKFAAIRDTCGKVPQFLINNTPPDSGFGGFVELAGMATISCTCSGTPCTGYPTTGNFSVFGTIAIMATTTPFDSPQLFKITVDFLLDSNPSGPSFACAFLESSVTHFEGESTELSIEDLVGSHVIVIENDNATMTSHTKLTVTVEFS